MERQERLVSTNYIKSLQHHERWKTGQLYSKLDAGGNDMDLVFRQSAFTTILLLTPSGFFASPEATVPIDIDWRLVANQANKQTAELTCIVYALKAVEKRWRRLNEYIAKLLTENFMDPNEYVKLLFDDETFGRSRLYFWVIGCLSEFDASIEDNLKQWELFRKARVTPFLQPHGTNSREEPQTVHTSDEMPEADGANHDEGSHGVDAFKKKPETPLQHLQSLDNDAREICQSLEDLRSQFQAKLNTVKTLRDGLFNASTLMESRSSTRLGQNVQLLTYVGIFYLPLAFCAAIPNITDGETRILFIVTAVLVGVITYAVVFNLGNIAEFVGRKYYSRRTKLLKNMKQNDRWRERGKELEQFRPNNDRKIPSEWWIIVYQAQRFAQPIWNQIRRVAHQTWKILGAIFLNVILVPIRIFGKFEELCTNCIGYLKRKIEGRVIPQLEEPSP